MKRASGGTANVTPTRGEQMLALRRARMAAAPPFLRGGFRPFFFGGALWAAVAILLWMANLSWQLPLPSAFAPLSWHRHEMLFGFVGAILAGYLLTSVANWTGWLPVAGAELLLLFLLWALGRAAMLASGWIGWLPAAIVDVGFYLVLGLAIAREVFAARRRDYSMLGPLLLLALANAVDHAEAAGLLPAEDRGIRAGLALVVLFISLVGGKLVPSFTRNWLAKQQVRAGLPGQPGRYDRAAILATVLALAAWVAFPAAWPTAWLLLLAGVAQLVRLGRWRGWRVWREPGVLILHIGYLWIPLGLLLLGAALAFAWPPSTLAIHALAAGGMATMILAVMTRTALSQTGRPWPPARYTTPVYLLVSLGALLRLAAALWPGQLPGLLPLAALFWGGAFLWFVFGYRRIFFASRADDPDG